MKNKLFCIGVLFTLLVVVQAAFSGQVTTSELLKTDSSEILRVGPDAFALDERAAQWRDIHLVGTEFASLPLHEVFYQPRRVGTPYSGSRHYLLCRVRGQKTIADIVKRYGKLVGEEVESGGEVTILSEALRLHHLHHGRENVVQGDFCPLLIPCLTYDCCAGVIICQMPGMTIISF